LRDERIDDVLFVIDVVVSAAFEDDSMKEERDIDIHVIDRFRWKEVNVEENVQDDEAREFDEIEIEVDNSVVSRVDDWNQSKIYARTGISNEWERWRWWLTEEWKERDDEFADETYDACSRNDICSKNHETKWWDCQQATEVSKMQRDVTSIFEVWISHGKEEQSREKKKDRIVWKWSERGQNAAMKAIAKHQDREWIAMSHECRQSVSRSAEVDDRGHNDGKELSDDCHDHWRREKFVVHVVDMMQSERHQHHCDVVDRIETEYEATMREYEHHMRRVKQQTIIRCDQDCISDIEIRDEWRILNVYQSIASHAGFESNCDWWMSCDVKWTTQFSMTDAAVERFDEREDADDFVDDDIVAQQRKRVVKQNELQGDKDDVVSSQNNLKEREISSGESEEWRSREERRIHRSDDSESDERLCRRENRDVL